MNGVLAKIADMEGREGLTDYTFTEKTLGLVNEALRPTPATSGEVEEARQRLHSYESTTDYSGDNYDGPEVSGKIKQKLAPQPAATSGKTRGPHDFEGLICKNCGIEYSRIHTPTWCDKYPAPQPPAGGGGTNEASAYSRVDSVSDVTPAGGEGEGRGNRPKQASAPSGETLDDTLAKMERDHRDAAARYDAGPQFLVAAPQPPADLVERAREGDATAPSEHAMHIAKKTWYEKIDGKAKSPGWIILEYAAAIDAALAAERADAHAQGVREERERWLDCAQVDATMEGPKLRGWNRSALDRLWRAIAAPEPQEDKEKPARVAPAG